MVDSHAEKCSDRPLQMFLTLWFIDRYQSRTNSCI